MMSGTLPDQNHPSFSGRGPYQILNEKADGSAERARVREQCDKAFANFGELRGRIIAGTIAMEAVLDKVLASYYSPTVSADPQSGEVRIELFGPHVHRSTEFYDLILCEMGLNRKIDLLFKTLSLAGIHGPSGLREACKAVMSTRNRFAHRLIGIDAQTGDCFLWSNKGRTWEAVTADVESKHSTQYDKAMGLLSDVSSEIERLLASGEQYPESTF